MTFHIEQNYEEKLLDAMRDLTKFAPLFLKINVKKGTSKIEENALILNPAQLFIHARLESQLKEVGRVRALILKGRQQGCCFSEHMKVLTADYRWKKIKELEVGDKLVACDEESPGFTIRGRKKSRKFRTSIVEEKREFIKMTYEVIFDNGARLEVTEDHRLLGKQRGGDEQRWRLISDCMVGDQIRIATNPPNYECQTYEDGWMAGIIDGEGSARTGKGAKRLSVHQTPGNILQRIKSYFNNIGMPFKEVIDRRTKCGQKNKLGDKPVHRLDIHRLPYLIELLARCRPSRFTNDEWHIGHELPGKAAQDGIKPWATIVSIKPFKKQKVVDIQTSTKTFICEGLVSHNSTYVQARYFHKIVTTRGKKAFVLAHEGDATDNLFGMTKRYYENLPDGLCPKPDKMNMSEMVFSAFNSEYKVGTAGNKKTGRSQTIQLFHGSEVAFWENTDDLSTGALQAVSDDEGTEIILESTANGLGNYFHGAWVDATKGKSDYQAIFVPWYWQPEYIKQMEGFNLNDEEQELYSYYKDNGLTIDHLIWRRIKINNLHKDKERAFDMFKQEYPFTASEAFLNPTSKPFIPVRYVTKARNTTVETDANLIIGVDPADDKDGSDRTALIRRRGRRAYGLLTVRNHNTMELAGLLRRIIIDERPTKVYIDSIGIGKGTVDRLREMGFDCVEGIDVRNTAHEKDRYINRRAELWDQTLEWLMQDMPVEIPDTDELQSDLCSVGFKHDSSGRLKIEGKDELAKKGLPSPDCADSLIHTFSGGFYEISARPPPPRYPANPKGMFV